MRKERLLLIEPEVTGHHLIHIQLLCEHIVKNNMNFDFIFLVNPEFHVIMDQRNLSESLRMYKEQGIIFHPITIKEFKYYSHKNEITAALYKNILISRYIRKIKPVHVCMLMGDHLQYLFDPLFFFMKINISGIIFRPSVHYRPIFGCKLTLKEKIKTIRKTILYQKMLLSPVIKPLFTLDPYFVEYAHKKYINGKKMEFLPDISGLVEQKEIKNYNPLYFTLPDDRTFFFMFGQISKRKGILVLLKALLSMPLEFQQKTAVLITGKIENSIKEEVLSLYRKVRKRTKILISLNDKYISDQDIRYYIKRCTVVLIPYQKFIGSSGLLQWALQAGKPVLTQNYGLIGKLVSENNLGITLNTEDEESLCNGMVSCITSKLFNSESIKNYHRQHTDSSFHELLLKSITKQ